jgi:hypothetical protein
MHLGNIEIPRAVNKCAQPMHYTLFGTVCHVNKCAQPIYNGSTNALYMVCMC